MAQYQTVNCCVTILNFPQNQLTCSTQISPRRGRVDTLWSRSPCTACSEVRTLQKKPLPCSPSFVLCNVISQTQTKQLISIRWVLAPESGFSPNPPGTSSATLLVQPQAYGALNRRPWCYKAWEYLNCVGSVDSNCEYNSLIPNAASPLFDLSSLRQRLFISIATPSTF